MLDDDRIAREHRRHDDVDGGEQRVVPRGQVENDAERLFHDAALEARLDPRNDVGQTFLGDARHVARAKGHPVDLASRLGKRLAHHGRDVAGHRVGVGEHGFDGA